MPCFGGDDYCTSGVSSAEYRRLERQAEFFKAALCASLTLLESKVPGFLDQMDWIEAGIPRGEVNAWWNEHKQDDLRRRQRESEAVERKRIEDELRHGALSKLTLDEQIALGIVKRGTSK